MPFEMRPTRDNPIYVEWKKWADICDACYSSAANEARKSIERIAEFVYKGRASCIVGAMIIMRDTEQMEADEIREKGEGG